MAVSDATVAFIKDKEGFNPKPYYDNGHYSIGYGTYATADEIKNGTSITREQGEARLKTEAAKADEFVSQKFTATLSEDQRTALISLVYNVGPGNIGSGLTNAINSGDTAKAGQLIAMYNNSTNPADKEGLTARRNAERALYEGKGSAPNASATAMGASAAMYNQNQAIPASFSLAERASAIPTQGFRPNSSLTMAPTNAAPLSMAPQTQAPTGSYDYDPLASGTYPRTFPQPAPQGDPYDYDPLASGTYPRSFPAQPAPLVAQAQPDVLNNRSDPSYRKPAEFQFTQLEPYENIPAGPYGADKVARAMLSGDKAALDAAGKQLYDTVVAAKGQINIGGLLAAQKEVSDYFTKTLPAQVPGAVRQAQTTMAQNPAINLPPDQKKWMADAVAALPPATTSSMQMPRMRPEGLNYPEPQVAQAPQSNPLAPQMASYTTSSPAPQVTPATDPYAYDPLASGTYPQTEMPQQSHPWTQHQAQQPQQTQQPEYDPFATADVSTYQQAPQQPASFVDPYEYDPLASGTYPQSQPGHPWVTPQQPQQAQQPSHPWVTPQQQSASVQAYAQPAMPSHPWANPMGVVPGLPIPQAGMTPQPQQAQQPQMQAPQTFATQVAPQTKTAEQQLAEYYGKPTDDNGDFAPTSWSGGWGYSDDTQFLPDLDAMNGNRGWA